MAHSNPSEELSLFVTCGGGLEPLLVAELAAMGYQDTRAGFRGVTVRSITPEAIYRINYCSRIGGRVLLPLKNFRCQDKKSLYDAAMEIEWQRYVPKGKTISID